MTYGCFCEISAKFTSEHCDAFDCDNVRSQMFSSTQNGSDSQGMWTAPSGNIEGA